MVFGLKLGSLQAKKAPADDPAPKETQSATKSTTSSTGKTSSGTKGALTVNEFVARTKRCREKGLEPTKPELIAYARYLGIDPIIDADLMWIVDEALVAPLPAEWTEHHDSSDRVFYHHYQSHSSSWTHPLEQLHRDTYKAIVNFRTKDLTKEEQLAELERLRRKCDDAERDAHRELQAWEEHVDEDNKKFYYNREKQCSAWTDPRPARCHELYLQMKALRVLSKHCGMFGGGRADTSGGDGPLHSDRDRIRSNQLKSQPLVPSGARDNSIQEELTGNEDASGSSKEDRRRKKKRRDPETSSKSQDSSSIMDVRGSGSARERETNSSSPTSVGNAGGVWRNSALDLQRPATSVVQEVRAALGVSPSLPPMGRAWNHNHSHFDENGRLPSPLGDGLSGVGRVKVRAGIKLQPIA
mmetsp:Transcript_107589/g.302934  ORF Transcript_107589/g.302934 Transcript_107589/m.302934 type:complete len:413 (+) Transcript_107589:49-1287(+)